MPVNGEGIPKIKKNKKNVKTKKKSGKRNTKTRMIMRTKKNIKKENG
jgi:hypothetical protein